MRGSLATKTIAIALAVYEPNLSWLREQLISLNQQTYPSLHLYVRDDASPSFSVPEIEALLKELITAFPYTFARNQENMGSNATFSLLTEEAEGDWIAYCDQDDLWASDKLEKLSVAMQEEGTTLVYSDMEVIDGAGELKAKSLADVKPHLCYREGEGLATVFLSTNFVTGCALLMSLSVAKEAVPFLTQTVHDQWLGMVASKQGRLAFVQEPLVKYRMHQSNQTGTLAKINTKADYYQKRVMPYEGFLSELHRRIDLGDEQKIAEHWAQARISWMKGSLKGGIKLFFLRKIHRKITWFELALPFLPGFIFRRVIKKIQAGKL